MEAATLVIALMTLTFVAIEYRERRRDRPRVDWTVINPATTTEGEKCSDVFEVTNTGAAAAVNVIATFVGARQTIQDDFRVPTAMPST